MFDVGRNVEVSFDREDRQDAWFPATIQEDLGNGAFVVEYCSEDTDNKVQALKDVSVPSSDDGMHGHLTLVNSSATVATVPMNYSGDRKDSCDRKSLSSLTLRKGQFEQLTSDNKKMSHMTASLTKRISDSRGALSQPLKKLVEGNVLGSSQQVTDDRSIEEMCVSVSPVSVNYKASSARQTATGDRSSDHPSWGRRLRRKQRNIDATEKFGEAVNLTSSYDYEPKSQLESLELNIEGKEQDALGNTTLVQNEQVKEEAERPVIIGLPCTEMGSSEFGRKGKRGCHSNSKVIMSPGNGQMQQLNDSTILKMKDSKQLEVVEFSQRRKRGRPRKLQSESMRTSVAENGVVGSDDVYRKDNDPHRVLEVEVMEVTLGNQEKMVFNDDELTNGRLGPKSNEGSIMKRTFAKMHNEKVVKDSITLQENRSFKRGRRRVRGEKVALQVQDSFDSSGGKMMEINCTVAVNKVICEAPSNELDDEPLSKWIEGMHASSFIDGSRPSPVSTMVGHIENGEKQRDNIALEEEREKQPENGKGASVSVDEGSIVPCEQQSLPFVKNTVLWKTIESMEVFQRIPQRPHFQPLENFRESSREGLAIGYMVTFSSVVEKISRLQVNDPKSITDDILETLADLERQGFDVRAVRERVAELLSVKDKQERLVDEVDKLNHQILEHNREKSRIDEEIREINEHIGKLQKKLSLAESAKEKEDDEIAALLARLKETEESINKVGRDFEGIAASRL
ncbi:UNVERIFIED_CONTAM: DUF724 domain-containing protein 7 [Sesamum latifolium]|uniref:DUF724 domain-containing protein 7 n=1 Tax=Sesamum latifolium TaxID=2727402 RepID=A0AAW2Y1X8_9LAMI